MNIEFKLKSEEEIIKKLEEETAALKLQAELSRKRRAAEDAKKEAEKELKEARSKDSWFNLKVN